MKEGTLIIASIKETAHLETRVALSPESCNSLIKKGMQVWIESGAGTASGFLDSSYQEVGVKIKPRVEIIAKADLLVTVQTPEHNELKSMKEGACLLCFLWALQHPETVTLLQELKLTSFGMDAIPRISRAQNMDALSSLSSIAGYKAALIAANELDKYLPMMMTAAGTIRPSKVLVLGAGVAGLQAIATSKRLGAVVEAFDIRPAVKEQVESLGAKFVEVPLDDSETETKGGYAKELTKDDKEKQRQVIHEHVKKSDVVITTALIPGRPAPLLITEAMVHDMKAGSVIVDIAAENGGNCAFTKAGETHIVDGVKVIGPLNLASQLAHHASLLYSKNILAFLDLLISDSEMKLNFEDEIILHTTITHQGALISPLIKPKEN